jgi:hypothetical protein
VHRTPDSVLRRALDVIDDEHLQQRSTWDELQPELFFNCREGRRRVRR